MKSLILLPALLLLANAESSKVSAASDDSSYPLPVYPTQGPTSQSHSSVLFCLADPL